MKPTLSWKLILILSLMLSLALVGCGRISRRADQAPDVSLALAVYPDPPAVGRAHLTVVLTGPDGTPIDGARLQIKGDMSHAGMVPVMAEVQGGEEGKYETSFEWNMGGDWIVTVTAALPDGRTTVRQFTYFVEGDICGVQSDEMQVEMRGTR